MTRSSAPQPAPHSRPTPGPLRSNQEADTITYSASISACEKGSHWPGALGLLARMQ